MRRLVIFILAIIAIQFSPACKHKPQVVTPTVETDFPQEIGNIFSSKCAVSGCHNQASYMNAGGLLLDSWENLFKGGSTGSDIIPFNSKNSLMLYYLNAIPDSGITAAPTMPVNSSPLSRHEYNFIKQWIDRGAPNKAGAVPFASEADTRQKIYLTQQGCDMVAVIDVKTNLVMRYIPIGMSGSIEAPHFIRVSNDGLYAYVSFIAGKYIQKIDTRTDTVVGSVNVGEGSWNAFLLSPDGKRIVVSNWQANGAIAFVNTDNMTVTERVTGIFNFPHGIASSPSFDTFFITAQYGNAVYKFAPPSYFKQLSIDGEPPVLVARKRDPHMILMHPDNSRYFLTCQASNEIRVMDAHSDNVLKAIPVGIDPQEMAMSKTKPYLFVTCSEDNSSLAGYKGTVYVINYNTLDIVKKIEGKFYQPHAISVDDQNGVFLIASRNSNPNGPAPHHSSSCAGRNGYYNIYDLNTLEPLPTNRRYEVTVEPYSSDVRFKN